MSTLYAIDPGTEQSALVQVFPDGIVGHYADNADILRKVRDVSMYPDTRLIIEQVESFGMPVGREVFETVFWSGRFAQVWLPRPFVMLPRKAVKLALCGSMKAKDPNIRQALIDRYGGPQSVKKGGPLAGIKSHCWSALALAVTYQELSAREGGR